MKILNKISFFIIASVHFLRADTFGTTVKGPIKEMLADIMEIVVDLGWIMIVLLGAVGIYIAKARKNDFPAFLGWAAIAIGFWLVCLTISKKGAA